MPLKIVRNDITKTNTEAIVKTANERPAVGPGCDSAVYKAAGYDELLAYRKKKIGYVPEGEAFITPGFHLQTRYIIHAVSPLYEGGSQDEEKKLRSCYRKSLQLAKEHHIRSIAFPLISTGGFGYPKEEGMRIAVDEINAFHFGNDMQVYLVVFDERATELGQKVHPDLAAYIDRKYVREKREEEYGAGCSDLSNDDNFRRSCRIADTTRSENGYRDRRLGSLVPGKSSRKLESASPSRGANRFNSKDHPIWREESAELDLDADLCMQAPAAEESFNYQDFEEVHESRLEERMRHLSDTFSQYLFYLIHEKNMRNADVYRRAIVDKKTFSKIKNNVDYHPQKLTALCLCVGAKLNLDESKDLLARAGYALSPCDKTDIIFSYFIENGIYDMIELDIQLEEHGLPCIIT